MATRRYRSPARERAAASTRSLILDAAAENFSLNGYPSATIAGIARTADVGVNTVYTAFGSKARLLATLITTAADNEITLHFDQVVAKAGTGTAVIQQLAESVRQNTERWYGVVTVALENSRADPVITEAWDAALRGYRQRLKAAVDLITDLGDASPRLSSAEAVDIMWFFLGPSPWRVLLDEGWSWDRAQQFLADQACAAVLRPGWRPAP